MGGGGLFGRLLFGGPGGGIVGFFIDSCLVMGCSGLTGMFGLLAGADSCCTGSFWCGEVVGGGGGAGFCFLFLLRVDGEAELKTITLKATEPGI